jgi:hypothetical protein
MSPSIYTDPSTKATFEVELKHSREVAPNKVLVEHRGVPLLLDASDVSSEGVVVGARAVMSEEVSGRTFDFSVRVVAVSDDEKFVVLQRINNDGSIQQGYGYEVKAVDGISGIWYSGN